MPRDLEVRSGGQTGVDRGALDAALALGLPCGGWCPRGRRAEDGPIADRYPLREAPSAAYPLRTEWNVRDSEGTLILHLGRTDRGTALTEGLARRYGRPLLRLDLRDAHPDDLRRWLAENGVLILNVAGPRESRAPGIQQRARSFLEAALLPPATQRGRNQ